jgi:hypothetical protein
MWPAPPAAVGRGGTAMGPCGLGVGRSGWFSLSAGTPEARGVGEAAGLVGEAVVEDDGDEVGAALLFASLASFFMSFFFSFSILSLSSESLPDFLSRRLNILARGSELMSDLYYK